MIIREYTLKDKKQIIKMVSDILGCLFNGNPEQFEYVKEFNKRKNYIKYLVAETQGEEEKIIATMALRKEDDKTLRLKRMYVRAGYRKRGIAQKMFSQLIDFAKQQGYKKILFSAYPVMENANRFFKRNKFNEINSEPEEQFHFIREL